MSELKSVVSDLTKALDDIESHLTKQPSPSALEDFKVMLDGVRTTLTAILTAADPADYHAFIRKFRLRRAAQVCQNVLHGLVDGTIKGDTPGFDRLRSTVEETLDRLAKFKARRATS